MCVSRRYGEGDREGGWTAVFWLVIVIEVFGFLVFVGFHGEGTLRL